MPFILSRPVSREHTDGTKTRNEFALASLAPSNRFPHRGGELECKIFNRKNTCFIRLFIGRRIANSSCLPGLIEDNSLRFDFGNIAELPINQTLTKGISIAVGAVTDHDTLWNIPGKRLVDQIQSDLPLALKENPLGTPARFNLDGSSAQAFGR